MIQDYKPDEQCKAEIQDVQDRLDIVRQMDQYFNICTCIVIFILVAIVTYRIHYREKKWERFEITIIVCLLCNYSLLLISEII